MEHYMIIKLKNGIDAASLYEPMSSLLKEAERIDGIRKADVFLSSYRLKGRYDMMIRIRMKKEALSSFEDSDVYRDWKKQFEDKIETMTVFDK